MGREEQKKERECDSNELTIYIDDRSHIYACSPSLLLKHIEEKRKKNDNILISTTSRSFFFSLFLRYRIRLVTIIQ